MICRWRPPLGGLVRPKYPVTRRREHAKRRLILPSEAQVRTASLGWSRTCGLSTLVGPCGVRSGRSWLSGVCGGARRASAGREALACDAAGALDLGARE